MSGYGWADLWLYLPVLLLAGWGLVVLGVGAFVSREEGGSVLTFVSLAGVALAGASLLWLWRADAVWGRSDWAAFAGTAWVDPLGLFLCGLVLLAVLLAVLMSPALAEGGSASSAGILHGEYFALVLLAGAGIMALVLSNHLVVLFLALETFSVSVYVLAGIARASRRSSEAALKYFVLGAFSSAFFLYGIALYYGATGHFHLAPLGPAPAASADQTLLAASLSFLLVGLAFKIGAVPFHWWVPDVYEGAPTAVTSLMATAVKVGAFAFLVRVLFGAWHARPEFWFPAVWSLAAATMVWGALVALWQTNVKRLLAYSSIAHTGYLLIGFAVSGRLEGGPAALAGAAEAVVFYLTAYVAMTAGAFACVASLERASGEGGGEQIESYRGLAYTRPGTALALAVFLLSLAGIPPTAGFVAKFYLLKGAVDAGLYGLAGVGLLTTLLALYYYVRVIVLMYMHDPEEAAAAEGPATEPWGMRWAIGLALAGALGLGLAPGAVSGALSNVAVRLAQLAGR